jgi:hypothetical protein
MAFPEDWGRKCELEIQDTNVDSTLAYFPLPFTIDNLPSEMLDADGTYPALNGGGDIRFSSDSEGVTRLPCEVVDFTTNNNPALGSAQIWVAVPSISSSTTTSIWVWYNKSAESQPAVGAAYGRNATWDENGADNFYGVWHLEETPSGSGDMIDSTGNNDGTATNMESGDQISGKIGGSLNLNASGSGERVDIPDSAFWTISSGETITFEGWILFTDLPSSSEWWSTFESDNADYALQFTNYGSGTTNVDWYDGSSDHEGPGQSVSEDEWYYHACALELGQSNGSTHWWDGSNIDNFTAGNFSHNSDDFSLGGVSYSPAWRGGMDEMRVSGVKRPDAWLKATYHFSNSPGSNVLEQTPESPITIDPTDGPVSFVGMNF